MAIGAAGLKVHGLQEVLGGYSHRQRLTSFCRFCRNVRFVVAFLTRLVFATEGGIVTRLVCGTDDFGCWFGLRDRRCCRGWRRFSRNDGRRSEGQVKTQQARYQQTAAEPISARSGGALHGFGLLMHVVANQRDNKSGRAGW